MSNPVINAIWRILQEQHGLSPRLQEGTHPLQAETSMLSTSFIEGTIHYKPKAGTVSTPAACVGKFFASFLAALGL